MASVLHNGTPTKAASGMITSALATSAFHGRLIAAISANDLKVRRTDSNPRGCFG